MLNIDDLIGIKFTSHGRSKSEGFDCYGLAIEVSRRLGHELKDLWYEKACPETFSDNALAEIENNQLIKTSDFELGNLIIFSDENGNMVHIGVLLDDDLFIHADVGGVRVTSLESYYRKKWEVFTWQQ